MCEEEAEAQVGRWQIAPASDRDLGMEAGISRKAGQIDGMQNMKFSKKTQACQGSRPCGTHFKLAGTGPVGPAQGLWMDRWFCPRFPTTF